MNIEKEVRFLINGSTEKLIKQNTALIKPVESMTDLVMGYYGFDSLNKLGYICRIRQKNPNIVLEVKRLREDGSWEEESLKLSSIAQGYSFLSKIGLKPYLLIERKREERETPDFKIALDDVSLLGKFVEIELKDISKNCEKELNAFITKSKISGQPQKLYGDIFKEKCETDTAFKAQFQKRLQEILNGIE